ncbi:MAG: hypothetical protein HY716_13205 [Planctomycetes bacterium]|nr:hypothetical protein [Planctomycetota bacterium]
MAREKPTLKVGVDWIELEIVSEPYVLMTMRGYAPVVDAKPAGGEPHVLFIGSRSLGEGIEGEVKKRDGKFSGIRMRVRKESEDKMAKYMVEIL